MLGLLSSGRVFADRTDRYRDAHEEVARRGFSAVRVGVGRGLPKPRSRDDDGGRLAPRFIGAFAHETRALCGSCGGLTGPWPVALPLCGLGRCIAWAGRTGGSLGDLSGVAAAAVGRRRWCVGQNAALWRSANQVGTWRLQE